MEFIETLNLHESLKIEDTIEIAGFKANIENIQETLEKIDKIKNSCCNCTIQLMDANAIAGEKHFIHGIIHGLLAFKRKNNLANDLGIEICLRISAQRQISKALNILGLKTGEMNIAIVLVNCPDYFIDELSIMFIRDDSVLKPNDLILKEIYNLSENELEMMDIEDILIDKTSDLIVKI